MLRAVEDGVQNPPAAVPEFQEGLRSRIAEPAQTERMTVVGFSGVPRRGGAGDQVRSSHLVEPRPTLSGVTSEMPEALGRWVDRFSDRCRRPAVGAIGLYVAGSISTGGFHADLSDLDLVLVVASPLEDRQLDALVGDLLELGLPPVADGLDMDVFTGRGLRHPDPDPGWRSWIRWTADGGPVITGDGLQISDWAPALAVARDRAIAVFGPAAGEAFGPVSRDLVLRACRQELAGWNHYEPFWSLHGGVLTACRVWWYWAEGGLGSKVDAGRWAIGRADGEDRRLIRGALDQQLTGADASLSAASVIAFVRRIAGRVAP